MSDTEDSEQAAKLMWASARLRMARMVHPHGCEALVDHVVLFYAPFFPALSRVLEIGRALERDLERKETDAGRIEWRLVKVLTLDVPRDQDPDGAEIYSELIDRTGSSFGKALQPESSTPVRRRLMTTRNHSALADGVSWYSAKARMIRTIDAPVDDMFDDRVYTFRSTSFEAAFARVIEIGRAQESQFVNWNGHRAEWRLADILSLNLLGSGELGDAIDVYSEPAPMSDADRVPFDTIFQPERSTPETTGV